MCLLSPVLPVIFYSDGTKQKRPASRMRKTRIEGRDELIRLRGSTLICHFWRCNVRNYAAAYSKFFGQRGSKVVRTGACFAAFTGCGDLCKQALSILVFLKRFFTSLLYGVFFVLSSIFCFREKFRAHIF
jgi:hypothetical protein